jgi:methionyl-tRNA formyltransferase
VFLGGKNIGYECLKYLLEKGENVVGAFINTYEGKNKETWYNWTLDVALEYHIPVYRYEDINSRESIKVIKNMKPDIIFTIYYDQILEQEVIDIPTRHCINLHFGLSEEYRGCFPTTWVLINGEKETGITLHIIDENIDSGNIIAQEKVSIDDFYTGESLYNELTLSGFELFVEYFDKIKDGNFETRKQMVSKNTKYYNRQFPNKEIDFNKPGEEIYNFIRALIFPPFEYPYFFIGKEKYTIQKEKYG